MHLSHKRLNQCSVDTDQHAQEYKGTGQLDDKVVLAHFDQTRGYMDFTAP